MLLQKFQEGGSIGEPLDFFAGKLTGQLKGDLSAISNEFDGKKFTMKQASDYWDNADVKDIYNGNHDSFMEDYKASAQQLQILEAGDFDAYRTKERLARGGMEGLFKDVKTRKHYFDQTIEYQTSS